MKKRSSARRVREEGNSLVVRVADPICHNARLASSAIHPTAPRLSRGWRSPSHVRWRRCMSPSRNFDMASHQRALSCLLCFRLLLWFIFFSLA
jgi:hypothetical protein